MPAALPNSLIRTFLKNPRYATANYPWTHTSWNDDTPPPLFKTTVLF